MKIRKIMGLFLMFVFLLVIGIGAQAKDTINIGFSFPGANHAWLASILASAEKEAAKWPDVKLIVTNGENSSTKQIDDVESLIARGVDVIVILPQEGAPLTPVCKKAMKLGIPVINVDRELIDPAAYYTWIGGDNYGCGVALGQYVTKRLHGKGKVVCISGLPGVNVTILRDKGFMDVLKDYPGIKVVSSSPGDYLQERALTVMEDMLTAHSHVDAVYTIDDEMALGAITAIETAGRGKEMFVTGVGGLKKFMEMIKAGDNPAGVTATYLPIMAGSAIRIARMVVKKESFAELWEKKIPKRIEIRAEVVTKENAEKYIPFGY